MYLSDVIEKALPSSADEVLKRILAEHVVPAWDDGRHRVGAWGRFDGHLTESLILFAAQPTFTGALVVAEEEAERSLFLQEGHVVGAASNVLFERLGRLLYQAEVVTHADSEQLVATEEKHGDEALLDWIPDAVLAWAVARRLDAVAAALPYIRRGHFVLVEGELDLRGLAALDRDPAKVGKKARRQYEAWRHGDDGDEGAKPADAPEPLPSPLERLASREEQVDDILRRIREADLDFR